MTGKMRRWTSSECGWHIRNCWKNKATFMHFMGAWSLNDKCLIPAACLV
jgi:hypothetical protein